MVYIDDLESMYHRNDNINLCRSIPLIPPMISVSPELVMVRVM